MIKDQKKFNEYIDFLVERQKIYIKKQNQDEYPWTNDYVLQRAKINNIFRQQDKFTKFEIEQLKDVDFEEQVFRILILRHSISIPLYNLFKKKQSISLDDIYKLKQHFGGGDNFISTAIMFPTKRGQSREDLIHQHYNVVLSTYKETAKKINEFSTSNDVFKYLRKTYKLIGIFRIYEIYTSLTYCRDFKFKENDFFHVGPGSSKTFIQILGKEPTIDLAFDFLQLVKQRLIESNFNFNNYEFTLRTLEDSFCEFRKYTDIKNRIRNQYKVYHPPFPYKIPKGIPSKRKKYKFIGINTNNELVEYYNKLCRQYKFIIDSLSETIGVIDYKKFFIEQFDKVFYQLKSVQPSKKVFNFSFPKLLREGFFEEVID